MVVEVALYDRLQPLPDLSDRPVPVSPKFLLQLLELGRETVPAEISEGRSVRSGKGAVFEAAKYRDGYREKLEALIQAKLEARPPEQADQRRPVPVVNILDALQRSLQANAANRTHTNAAAANGNNRPPTKKRATGRTREAARLS